MKLDLTYFAIGGFFCEVLTETIKKFLKSKNPDISGGWILIFAEIFGLIYSFLTIPQTLKYQLGWSTQIPDWASAIITGIVISSFAKFYDYIFKFTNLKSKE